MSYANTIEPATALKTRLTELLRKARESGQPVILTQNGKAAAVLQDMASYERQRRSLLFLKLVAQGERDYREGAILSDEDAVAHFRAKLAELTDRKTVHTNGREAK